MDEMPSPRGRGKDLIAAGELGDIVAVQADHGQWFDYDPASRLFDLALGGGALLDLGVYPVSFASMLLGTPTKDRKADRVGTTGVDRQVSMIFGYGNGAQALLNTTSAAKTPTTATISGTRARIEIDGDFYAPSAFTFISRSGEARRFEFATSGRGLHYEAAEVARCLGSGLLESPLMPLEESSSIMRTMEAVLTSDLAQTSRGHVRTPAKRRRGCSAATSRARRAQWKHRSSVVTLLTLRGTV